MKALHLKYRPRSLKRLLGNDELRANLESVLSRPRDEIPHSMLFYGPAGCGKTTLARIVARALGADPAEVAELDAADLRGIDNARAIRREMHMMPLAGPVKVWILDEVHQMTKDAQSALLKALEDTPSHVWFLLATTHPEKLLPTIRSRCTPHKVAPLRREETENLLKSVLRRESKEVADGVLDAIYDHSHGSPRTALVMLDKVIDLDPETAKAEIAKFDIIEAQIIDLCRHLINGKGWSAKIRGLLKSLKESKEDPESIRRTVLGYCTSILLKESSFKAYIVLEAFKRPTYDLQFPGIVLSCYEAMNEITTIEEE